MRDLRDVPRERETREFGRELLMHFARPELRRLFRDVERRERLRRIILEEVGELLLHRLRVDIADDRQR